MAPATLWLAAKRYFGALALLCVGSLAAPPRAWAATPAPPSGALSGAISAERRAYYRQGLPQADAFVVRSIAAARLGPADHNNDTYLEARAADGQLVGYLRDFIGPVSPHQACPCNPLNLTLVFDPALELITLLAPAPLQKWGHEAMSPQEFARLITLVKALPPALCAVPTVEDMVDATTGATRTPLADVVVSHAALSTRRIAGLVQDTRALLQNAPIDAARQRLHVLLQKPLAPRQQARALAALLPQIAEQGVRLQAYQLMVRAYVQSLHTGAAPQPAVEDALLGFAVLCEGGGKEVAAACLQVAETGRRAPLVMRCADGLSHAGARGVAPHTAEYLRGTVAFMQDDWGQAVPLLQQAAQSRSAHDAPQLYMRLARAQQRMGAREDACVTARMLLRAHPLIPDGTQTLQACVSPTHSLAAEQADLERSARNTLLTQQVAVRGLPPSAALRPAAKQGTVAVPYWQPDTVTVWLYFATWCPHCQAELPHVQRFAAWLAQDPQRQRKVRIVAVRTAQEKETAAARRWWQSFRPSFPVYEDRDMSQAFAEFARATGRPMMLPTTAVVDGAGTVRFFCDTGLHRNIEQELRWATAAILDAPDAA